MTKNRLSTDSLRAASLTKAGLHTVGLNKAGLPPTIPTTAGQTKSDIPTDSLSKASLLTVGTAKAGLAKSNRSKAGLLADIKKSVGKNFNFKSGDTFYWSPGDNTIYYDKARLSEDIGGWSLLHELAHGVLAHQSYDSDYDLLMMEVAAWDSAISLGLEFGVEIDPSHVDDCLDTYRDWLHERSTCPSCSTVCLQASPTEYRCHNCYTKWRVSASRFCRPYRLRKDVVTQKSPEDNARTTFV